MTKQEKVLEWLTTLENDELVRVWNSYAYENDIILRLHDAELDNCKTTDEYDKLYNELFENEVACYSVHPVEISLKH